MTEGDITPALIDPANALLGMAALAAIFAAGMWWRFATISDKLATPEGWLARRKLGHAATLTAIALALSGVGYLLGRFTGGF